MKTVNTQKKVVARENMFCLFMHGAVDANSCDQDYACSVFCNGSLQRRIITHASVHFNEDFFLLKKKQLSPDLAFICQEVT